MDLDTACFLVSPAGSELLTEAKSLNGSFLQRLTALRKKYPASVVSAALELLELRHRAQKKFSRADEMFFTKEALEQSSGETVSRYRAERFDQDSRILDLACGIGGDAIALANRGFVTAVDNDPIKVVMAERNLLVYGEGDRAKMVCSDVSEILLAADSAFVDPSRRVEGRRSTSLTRMSPSLEFLAKLRESVPDCAVKLSPMTHDEELEALDGEIEFISDSGECKEALVWFGRFRTAEKRATVLTPGKLALGDQNVSNTESVTCVQSPQCFSMVDEHSERATVVEPSGYLYEPDPSVIRAHLVDQLALRIEAGKLDEHIAYLTSDKRVETPFARVYDIIESMPFNLKQISRRFRELGAGKVVVKKRGVPFEPQEIEDRLKLSGENEYILVLTRIQGKAWAIVCKGTSRNAVV
jgi:hypothetical protein